MDIYWMFWTRKQRNPEVFREVDSMKNTIKNISIILLVAYILACKVEVMTGTCLNAQGDGKLNTSDPYYNYISYASTDARPGDTVLTVDILNPLTTYSDDIIIRHDFIIAR